MPVVHSGNGHHSVLRPRKGVGCSFSKRQRSYVLTELTRHSYAVKRTVNHHPHAPRQLPVLCSRPTVACFKQQKKKQWKALAAPFSRTRSDDVSSTTGQIVTTAAVTSFPPTEHRKRFFGNLTKVSRKTIVNMRCGNGSMSSRNSQLVKI